MGDMFGVMKALVRNKYAGTIYPEHPRALDADRDRIAPGGRIGGYPGGGGFTGKRHGPLPKNSIWRSVSTRLNEPVAGGSRFSVHRVRFSLSR